MNRTLVRLMVGAGVIPVMIILPMYIFPTTVPFVAGPVSVYDARRMIGIAWAAAVLLALLHGRIRRAASVGWERLPVSSRVVAAAFVAWALLSSVASHAPAYALREWGLMTLLLVVLFPLGAILGGQRDAVRTLLAATLLLYAVLVMPSPLAHGFAHPRFLGHVVAVGAPVLLFSGSWPLALAAGPALGLGILNGTRALVLALLVVTAAAWLLWPDRARRMLPALAGIGVAAAVVVMATWLGQGGDLQAAVERGSSLTGRDAMWRDALGRFMAAPVLGVGPGLLASGGGVAGWAASPHNTILLVAAETGLVGLVCVAALAAQALERLPGLVIDRRPWALGLVSGGVDSMFAGSIITPASQALLVVVLALTLPTAADGASDRIDRHAVGWALLGLGTVALVMVLANLALPAAEQQVIGNMSPRFFGRGLIP